jgi:hypothetical protein
VLVVYPLAITPTTATSPKPQFQFSRKRSNSAIQSPPEITVAHPLLCASPATKPISQTALDPDRHFPNPPDPYLLPIPPPDSNPHPIFMSLFNIYRAIQTMTTYLVSSDDQNHPHASHLRRQRALRRWVNELRCQRVELRDCFR